MLYLISVICPATELHVTMLIIEGEPGNVYLARALEDARRHVQAATVMMDHNVCMVRPVETLVGTIKGIISIIITPSSMSRNAWNVLSGGQISLISLINTATPRRQSI